MDGSQIGIADGTRGHGNGQIGPGRLGNGEGVRQRPTRVPRGATSVDDV